MVINEFRYKLKPGADVDELLRLFNEVALPIYSKIPGFISMGIFKYGELHWEQASTEWDYILIGVWESREAKEKAVADGTINIERKDKGLARTGYYDKVMPMIEKIEAAWHTPLASA